MIPQAAKKFNRFSFGWGGGLQRKAADGVLYALPKKTIAFSLYKYYNIFVNKIYWVFIPNGRYGFEHNAKSA